MFTQAQLQAAWQQVRTGSRSAGIDGMTLDWFAAMAGEQLPRLLYQLRQQTYATSPMKGIFVPKRRGGKRLVGIPTVRDRIVQRLLLGQLYLPLEEAFLDCSYAYRPGRGIQTAARHLYSYYQFQPAWTIKADIARFFDNLCWGILLENLEALPLPEEVQALLAQYIRGDIVIGGMRRNFGKGVLQGSILSGALANLYLNEFDRQCLREGLKLVRYGDDFAVVCGSWVEANRTLERIREGLGRLYLSLQPEKTQIVAPDEGLIFLGYRFEKGEVFAPPPPVWQNGEWVVSDSGMPYFRRKKSKPGSKRESRPPKACSASLVAGVKPTTNLSHCWQDDMTSLYITDQGAYLNLFQQQFQVLVNRELRLQVPVNRVSHIVLFGCCNVSHGAVSWALRRRIPILYLSQKGRYFGRLATDGQAKVEYLMQQVLRSQRPEFVRQQAEGIVRAKLHNSRILLMRLNRRRRTAQAAAAIETLAGVMGSLPQAEDLDALRGYEGYGAMVYFQALGSLLTGVFAFEKRTKRPPTDPMNSLLSLGYTLLNHNVAAQIQGLGLHTHFGNLHVPRDNHPALVSDLMEEFRAQVVDSLVVYLINSKIFVPEDFTPPDEWGGVYLHPDALKKFLKHWEEKLQTQVTHPHTGYKVALRRCLELQVREYIACLMGEVEVYRPMIWKM